MSSEGHKIPSRLIKKWERAVKRVNAIVEEMSPYEPDVQMYLATDIIHLMVGPPHEDGPGIREVSRPDRSIEYVRMPRADGGDW